MATDKPITIALADSQYLVRLGLRHILEGSGQFSISFEAPNQDILLEKLRRQQVQVLILDHRQPNRFDENTILAVKEVSPQTNILIISKLFSPPHKFPCYPTPTPPATTSIRYWKTA